MQSIDKPPAMEVLSPSSSAPAVLSACVDRALLCSGEMPLVLAVMPPVTGSPCPNATVPPVATRNYTLRSASWTPDRSIDDAGEVMPNFSPGRHSAGEVLPLHLHAVAFLPCTDSCRKKKD